VREQWATLGEFDFVSIVEAPDERAMARLSLELGSAGALATAPTRPFRSTTSSHRYDRQTGIPAEHNERDSSKGERSPGGRA
jgi:GYD domain